MVYKVDYTVVGSGIVGLHAALRLREKHQSKILVLERNVTVRALRMLVLPALEVFLIIDDLNHIQRKFIS
jgi:flavin-dependent dehydrogenase